MQTPPPRIVLASSSPFRQELLGRLGLAFEACSPEIDESPRPGEHPRELVERLSLEKARAIAEQFPDALIIGSDQVADHDGEIVGKPRDHADAVRQLRAASGRVITLYTGVALFNSASGAGQVAVEPFEVEFRELDEERIEAYLRRERPYNCCGSVRAERLGIALLRRLTGNDPNALIGLPMIRLVAMLEKEGVDLLRRHEAV